MKDNLLVIGNGLDLQAKLKSDFNSFMVWVEQNDKEFINSNIWYMLFYATYLDNWQAHYADPTERRFLKVKDEMQKYLGIGNSQRWMDIEFFIFTFLTNDRAVSKLKRMYESSVSNKYIQGLYFSCENESIYHKLFNYAKGYKAEFYDFLYEQLRKFEDKFKEYLSILVENQDYKSNKTKIFNMANLIPEQTNILTFNYTDFIDPEMYHNETHVHGRLDTDIIIGIDLERINSLDLAEEKKKNLFRFSKTYRKMLKADKTAILSEKYQRIIFYGLSLSEQDFTYFKSIFDCCQIDQLNTVIEFWYSDNIVGKNPTKIREEYVSKITNLFLNYGNTLNNRISGSNLMNKLILNNKLIVPQAKNFID